MAILYKDRSNSFEISFNDKYKKADAYSTYEVRYSSSPITNENWAKAKPVSIQAHSKLLPAAAERVSLTNS